MRVLAVYPVIPINIIYIILVGRISAVIRISAIAGTEEGAEGAIVGIGHHLFGTVHIAELGAATELIDTTICDDGIDIAFCDMGCIDTTCIEFINVGIVNLPEDITMGMIGCRANTLDTCARYLAEAATIDITFCVIISIVIRRII